MFPGMDERIEGAIDPMSLRRSTMLSIRVRSIHFLFSREFTHAISMLWSPLEAVPCGDYPRRGRSHRRSPQR